MFQRTPGGPLTTLYYRGNTALFVQTNILIQLKYKTETIRQFTQLKNI